MKNFQNKIKQFYKELINNKYYSKFIFEKKN